MQQGAGPADPPVLAGRAAELGAVERFLAPGPVGRLLVVCGGAGDREEDGVAGRAAVRCRPADAAMKS